MATYEEAPIHRLTLEDVQRMYEAEILVGEDRVELLDGVLVDVPRSGPEHSGALAWLTKQLVLTAGERQVRVQDTLVVEGGFLSPDLIVTEPLTRKELASTALLAVEVAVTSHRRDTVKTARFARAGVDEYWIVDEPGRRVLVHRRPTQSDYADFSQYRDGDRIETPVASEPIDVSALLG